MTTIQITSQVSTEQLLHGVANLPAADLEQFVAKVLAIRAKLKAPSISTQEAPLLQQINHALPAQAQARFTALNHKRQAETLTEPEHQELLALIEQMEHLNVTRMQSLVQLATLRQVSVTTVMQDLDVNKTWYNHNYFIFI